MVQKSGWIWISLALLCGLVLTSYGSIYYYQESLNYQQLYGDALNELGQFKTHMWISILVDYGNGTKKWYNDTSVPIGATLFNATREVARVNYTVYSFGVLVNAVNGKGGDSGYYWLWYEWNSTSIRWDMGFVGADAFILHHGDIVSWVYEKSPW
jgi:hypothetical protein